MLSPKYFKLNGFINNMKAKVAIYNLFGKETLWQDNQSKLKKIEKEDLSKANSRITSNKASYPNIIMSRKFLRYITSARDQRL